MRAATEFSANPAQGAAQARPCPICASLQTVGFTESRGHALSICADCRHVYFEAVPEPDALSSYYALTYAEANQQQEKQVQHTDYHAGHVAELARRVGMPLGRIAIADIGCSFPVFLKQARNAGYRRTIGVDLSVAARSDGIAAGIEMLSPDDFYERIPDRSLDILRYSHALEHMPDPAAVLRRQIAKVRPGGLVYITQPSFPVFRAEPAAIDLKDANWPYHLHFFSANSLLRLAESCNLAIDRFFSTDNAEQALERYRHALDLDQARTSLATLAEHGEPLRGKLNGYPWYTGENAALYAFTPGGDRIRRGIGRTLGRLKRRLRL